MKNLVILFFITLSVAFCQSTSTNDGPIEVTSFGTVPFIVSYNTIQGDGGPDDKTDALTNPGNFADVSSSDYNKPKDEEVEDYFSIENIIAVDDFDANHYVKIKLTKGAWDLPANYIGKKSPEGTDLNEFLVKVNVTQPGYEPNSAEGLKPTDPFTKYYGLNDSEQEIISGGTINHGVENAQFDIDARVAFDWLSDIPGEYSISLTLSVVDGS